MMQQKKNEKLNKRLLIVLKPEIHNLLPTILHDSDITEKRHCDGTN